MWIFKINYHWFFSALSQSLAALIGLVGVFTIYRLQIQKERINNLIQQLRYFLERGAHALRYDYSHLGEKELFDEADEVEKNFNNNIENKEKDIKKYQKEIKQYNQKEKESSKYQRDVKGIESNIEKRKKDKENFSKKKSILRQKLQAIKEEKDLTKKIMSIAYRTIKILCEVFLGSVIGLMVSESLNSLHKTVWGLYGIIVVVIFVFFLIYALRLILICCRMSFNN